MWPYAPNAQIQKYMQANSLEFALLVLPVNDSEYSYFNFWYFRLMIQNTANRLVRNLFSLLAVFISFPLARRRVAHSVAARSEAEAQEPMTSLRISNTVRPVHHNFNIFFATTPHVVVRFEDEKTCTVMPTWKILKAQY
jgi:hypothetical protein